MLSDFTVMVSSISVYIIKSVRFILPGQRNYHDHKGDFRKMRLLCGTPDVCTPVISSNAENSAANLCYWGHPDLFVSEGGACCLPV